MRSGSKRPPTMVGRVDGMSGTFNLVLQDLALRKKYMVGSGAGRGRNTEQDKSNLVVAKPVPIPI